MSLFPGGDAMSATWPQVVCLYRETRTDGTYECIQAPGHDGSHYLVRLVQTPRKAA